MKYLKKFNEEIGNPSYPNPHNPMKQFVIVTKSESGDGYVYFIKHTDEPTDDELEGWLLENGSDISDEDEYPGEVRKCYESVVSCKEVPSIDSTDQLI